MFNKFIVFFLSIILTFSCTSSSTDNSDIASNYILITTAIRTSKESRLKFQDKFATAMDSFAYKDNPQINLDEQKSLLEQAKLESKKAESIVLATSEIDSTFRYKDKVLDMFKFLDKQYSYDYPEVFKIMEGNFINKNNMIAKLIRPSFDTLTTKANEMIKAAKSIVQKYDLKLTEGTN